MTEGIFFEDIEVGAVIRFGHVAVSREEAIEFAAKYDPQPFHLDDEAAAASHFGRLAISGWQTGALSMGMLARYFAASGFAGMGGAGIEDLRWLKPVHPGDTLIMEMEALDKRRSQSRPGMGIVRQKFTVRNQQNEAVMVYTAIGLIEVRQP